MAFALPDVGSIPAHGIHLQWHYRCLPWSERFCLCIDSGPQTQELNLIGATECEAFIRRLISVQ